MIFSNFNHCSRSSNKEPLQIEIPKSKVKVPSKGGGREPSVGVVGGGLLMAKNKSSSSSGAGLHYGKRKVFEFTDDDDDEAELEMADYMSTCVLAGSDAHSIAGAVIGALTVSVSPANHEEGVANGEQQSGKGGKQAPSSSLKTVIRLPASKQLATAAAAAAVKKSAPAGKADPSVEQPKKRGRPPGSTAAAGRNSASPTDDQPATPPAVAASRPDKPAASATSSTTSGGGPAPNAAAAAAAEDNNEKLSMVVPEKASSYNIHPERCCSDVCHYCSMKFGMLDTPLHISQMKSEDVQRLACEFAKVTRDACLCDKCFRFIDRGAKTKRKERLSGASGGGSKEGKGGARWEGGQATSGALSGDPTSTKEERMRMCIVRGCTREVTSTVSKKWLIRLRKKLNAKKVLAYAIFHFSVVEMDSSRVLKREYIHSSTLI